MWPTSRASWSRERPTTLRLRRAAAPRSSAAPSASPRRRAPRATGYPGHARPAGAGPLQTMEASAAWASARARRRRARPEPSCPRARRRRAARAPLEPQILLIPQFVRRPMRRPEARRRHPQRRAARRVQHGDGASFLVGDRPNERVGVACGFDRSEGVFFAGATRASRP